MTWYNELLNGKRIQVLGIEKDELKNYKRILGPAFLKVLHKELNRLTKKYEILKDLHESGEDISSKKVDLMFDYEDDIRTIKGIIHFIEKG